MCESSEGRCSPPPITPDGNLGYAHEKQTTLARHPPTADKPLTLPIGSMASNSQEPDSDDAGKKQIITPQPKVSMASEDGRVGKRDGNSDEMKVKLHVRFVSRFCSTATVVHQQAALKRKEWNENC